MDLFLEGFLLQASLILALGAQNIFVLESGIKRQKHILVALVCSLCDLVLIVIGVLGAAALFLSNPILKSLFGVVGVLFLLFYGVVKLRESLRPGAKQETVNTRKPLSARKVLLLALSFSLLNPHVYLDTLVLIGSYASKFPGPSDRLSFGGGASFFSMIWFMALSIFASKMQKFLDSRKKLRYVSFISAIILIALAGKLGSEVLTWL